MQMNLRYSLLFLRVQILSAEQIRAWDQYTILHEPISSIDLMERAAKKCVEWIKARNWSQRRFHIFCGKGNNGGDGLAIGRMLLDEGYNISIYILEFGKPGSDDFQFNLQRLEALTSTSLHFLQTDISLPSINENEIIIDALFGSGLNKPLDGLAAALVRHINTTNATRISIDLPSGLFPDHSSIHNSVVRANFTLTFQCYKIALLLQENALFIGEVTVLDIGLHSSYLATLTTTPFLLTEKIIKAIYKPRQRFAHKGTYGHALLVGGSFGKIGAMVLATKACMRTGTGLMTAMIPGCGYTILQTTSPEAMVIADSTETHLANLPDDIEKFAAIGIGPGMGTHAETQNIFSYLLRRFKKPMIIDADGLNILSQNKEWLPLLPPYSILTPHPKEFDRLFGDHQNDVDRMEKAKQMAKELKIIIVLKSHHSLVAFPDGDYCFNSTGNAGMAKGGSGDVLTGILSSLLAQGYTPLEAAQFGVYVHGWAGDFAAKCYSKEAMLPTHIINSLSSVFKALQ